MLLRIFTEIGVINSSEDRDYNLLSPTVLGRIGNYYCQLNSWNSFPENCFAEYCFVRKIVSRNIETYQKLFREILKLAKHIFANYCYCVSYSLTVYANSCLDSTLRTQQLKHNSELFLCEIFFHSELLFQEYCSVRKIVS